MFLPSCMSYHLHYKINKIYKSNQCHLYLTAGFLLFFGTSLIYFMTCTFIFISWLLPAAASYCQLLQGLVSCRVQLLLAATIWWQLLVAAMNCCQLHAAAMNCCQLFQAALLTVPSCPASCSKLPCQLFQTAAIPCGGDVPAY
jgi:hypothetical protein